jgi:hypothetical protein
MDPNEVVIALVVMNQQKDEKTSPIHYPVSSFSSFDARTG